MNIHDRNQRRDRALNIFRAEAREQQLSAIALRKATIEVESAVPINAPQGGDTRDPVAGLHTLGRAVEANILDAHRQLQTARTTAARMAAVDPELARLNAQIDGTEPAPSGLQGHVIDGEVIEVTSQDAESSPRLIRP